MTTRKKGRHATPATICTVEAATAKYPELAVFPERYATELAALFDASPDLRCTRRPWWDRLSPAKQRKEMRRTHDFWWPVLQTRRAYKQRLGLDARFWPHEPEH
jgi:hypothetical protein